MRRALHVWRMLNDKAESLRRLSGRYRSPEIRGILRMAASFLEGLAIKSLDGAISMDDLSRIDESISLLRLYGAPTTPLVEAKKILLSSGMIRRTVLPQYGTAVLASATGV